MGGCIGVVWRPAVVGDLWVFGAVGVPGVLRGCAGAGWGGRSADDKVGDGASRLGVGTVHKGQRVHRGLRARAEARWRDLGAQVCPWVGWPESFVQRSLFWYFLHF